MSRSAHTKRHRLIAVEIARCRREAGMTQAAVATALGRHQPFIANIESGERRVDLVELIDLAEIVGLDIELLIGRLRRLDG
jgi:transcriptional regulator with XRE-family HTH domain